MTAFVPLVEADSTNHPCATPECRRKRGSGLWGLFCGPCAKNLARIRDWLDEETDNRRKDWASKGNGLKAVSRGLRCNAEGCDEPRPKGQVFCSVCRAMGLEEDAAA